MELGRQRQIKSVSLIKLDSVVIFYDILLMLQQIWEKVKFEVFGTEESEICPKSWQFSC